MISGTLAGPLIPSCSVDGSRVRVTPMATEEDAPGQGFGHAGPLPDGRAFRPATPARTRPTKLRMSGSGAPQEVSSSRFPPALRNVPTTACRARVSIDEARRKNPGALG